MHNIEYRTDIIGKNAEHIKTRLFGLVDIPHNETITFLASITGIANDGEEFHFSKTVKARRTIDESSIDISVCHDATYVIRKIEVVVFSDSLNAINKEINDYMKSKALASRIDLNG